MKNPYHKTDAEEILLNSCTGSGKGYSYVQNPAKQLNHDTYTHTSGAFITW